MLYAACIVCPKWRGLEERKTNVFYKLWFQTLAARKSWLWYHYQKKSSVDIDNNKIKKGHKHTYVTLTGQRDIAGQPPVITDIITSISDTTIVISSFFQFLSLASSSDNLASSVFLISLKLYLASCVDSCN